MLRRWRRLRWEEGVRPGGGLRLSWRRQIHLRLRRRRDVEFDRGHECALCVATEFGEWYILIAMVKFGWGECNKVALLYISSRAPGGFSLRVLFISVFLYQSESNLTHT
jgi:hypothetical protein